jgi:hypothetical protein
VRRNAWVFGAFCGQFLAKMSDELLAVLPNGATANPINLATKTHKDQGCGARIFGAYQAHADMRPDVRFFRAFCRQFPAGLRGKGDRIGALSGGALAL